MNAKEIPNEVRLELETQNKCFSDISINYFVNLVRSTTDFDMIDVVFYYFPELYSEKNEDDVQILYGGEIGENVIGHFICVFYTVDDKIVHVFDSLNRNVLHERQMEIINHRYPRRKEIIFVKPKTLQSDDTSCGPLCIAYATTVILGGDPMKYEYKMNINGDQSMFLREHIKNIFEKYKLSHFPQDEKSQDDL